MKLSSAPVKEGTGLIIRRILQLHKRNDRLQAKRRRLKPMSLHTEEAYVSWVKSVSLLHEERHSSDRWSDDMLALLTPPAVHGCAWQGGGLHGV